ncbi:unnamed protein product [Periconia digitata]|uniref:Uncharacterized protein n=1 Tax=Periconia digitata TaxID=1303443 RepID=A0A9W4UR86_9PLEO|nr:unnamed protein product [Periconia digitata]
MRLWHFEWYAHPFQFRCAWRSRETRPGPWALTPVREEDSQHPIGFSPLRVLPPDRYSARVNLDPQTYTILFIFSFFFVYLLIS